MEIITNVQRFQELTNVNRTTDKNIIDAYILYYKIYDENLIADIYQVNGVDGTDVNEYNIEEYISSEHEEIRYIITDVNRYDYNGEHYTFEEALKELKYLKQ